MVWNSISISQSPIYISAYQALFRKSLRAATLSSALSNGLASQTYVKGDNACHCIPTERLEMRATVISFLPRSTTDLACAGLQGLKNEPVVQFLRKITRTWEVLSHVYCPCSIRSRSWFLVFLFCWASIKGILRELGVEPQQVMYGVSYVAILSLRPQCQFLSSATSIAQFNCLFPLAKNFLSAIVTNCWSPAMYRVLLEL